MTVRRFGLAGALATGVMDVIGRTVVAPALGVQAPSPGALGRWIGHMRHRRFLHQDIADAQTIRNEAAIGTLAHYAIGVTLGAGYGLLTGARHADPGSPTLALAYGGATTAFSWFLMFPATGQGLPGRRDNRRLSALSLLNHITYGAALGLASAKLGGERDHDRGHEGTEPARVRRAAVRS